MKGRALQVNPSKILRWFWISISVLKKKTWDLDIFTSMPEASQKREMTEFMHKDSRAMGTPIRSMSSTN
jgi:hypothetical protein